MPESSSYMMVRADFLGCSFMIRSTFSSVRKMQGISGKFYSGGERLICSFFFLMMVAMSILLLFELDCFNSDYVSEGKCWISGRCSLKISSFFLSFKFYNSYISLSPYPSRLLVLLSELMSERSFSILSISFSKYLTLSSPFMAAPFLSVIYLFLSLSCS